MLLKCYFLNKSFKVNLEPDLTTEDRKAAYKLSLLTYVQISITW